MGNIQSGEEITEKQREQKETLWLFKNEEQRYNELLTLPKLKKVNFSNIFTDEKMYAIDYTEGSIKLITFEEERYLETINLPKIVRERVIEKELKMFFPVYIYGLRC